MLQVINSIAYALVSPLGLVFQQHLIALLICGQSIVHNLLWLCSVQISQIQKVSFAALLSRVGFFALFLFLAFGLVRCLLRVAPLATAVFSWVDQKPFLHDKNRFNMILLNLGFIRVLFRLALLASIVLQLGWSEAISAEQSFHLDSSIARARQAQQAQLIHTGAINCLQIVRPFLRRNQCAQIKSTFVT